MSLKAFHIAFIALSATLCLFLVVWGYNEYKITSDGQGLGLAILGVLGLMALIPYYFWFLKKSKKLVMALALGLPLWLFYGSTSWACSVCFGDPNSVMTKGIKAGIILLILVVGSVLGAIAAICFSWARRARILEEASR